MVDSNDLAFSGVGFLGGVGAKTAWDLLRRQQNVGNNRSAPQRHKQVVNNLVVRRGFEGTQQPIEDLQPSFIRTYNEQGRPNMTHSLWQYLKGDNPEMAVNIHTSQNIVEIEFSRMGGALFLMEYRPPNQANIARTFNQLRGGEFDGVVGGYTTIRVEG